jgi:hypothetical protein
MVLEALRGGWMLRAPVSGFDLHESFTSVSLGQGSRNIVAKDNNPGACLTRG